MWKWVMLSTATKSVSATVQAKLSKALKILGVDKKVSHSASSYQSNLTWVLGKLASLHSQERPKKKKKPRSSSSPTKQLPKSLGKKASSQGKKQAEVFLRNSDWRYDAPIYLSR